MSLPPQRPLSRAMTAHWGPSRVPQAGLGLLGIMVTLVLAGSVVAAVGTVYIHGQRKATVATGVSQTRALNQGIQASYSSAANFNQLNQAHALQEGVFPKAVLDRNGQPVNPWGGSIQVAGVDLPGEPAGNSQGFAITYEQVPEAVCAQFVANGAAGFYQTKVEGQTVAQRAKVNVASAAALCNEAGARGATVQFLQVKASPDGPTSPVLTPCVPSPSQTQYVACPAGQISSVSPYSANGIEQKRDSFCNSPYGASGWTPWVQTGSTCAPICTPPATLVENPTQPAVCAPGRVTPAGAPGFTQTRQRTTTYACPAPTGPYSTSVGPWSDWGPLETAACAPKCIAPAATTGSQGITGACPAGQVTGSGATTFAQTQTRSVTYACPAPTGGYTTNYGPWSAATPAVASVCAPKCVAPGAATNYEYQWVGVNAGCPAGWGGAHTYQKQQRRTVTTTYSCPAPQGGYTGSNAYSGWGDTGATQADSNSCAPVNLHYVYTNEGCSYNSFWAGGVGAIGGCVRADGSYVNVTENAFWGAWNPNWDAAIRAAPKALCQSYEVVANAFFGGHYDCALDIRSPNPPASCSVPGSTYIYAAVSTSLDCGQSGDSHDCGTDDSQSYQVYRCQ